MVKVCGYGALQSKNAGRNRTEMAAPTSAGLQDLLSASDFSIHFVIATIPAARKPFFRTRTASIVVPRASTPYLSVRRDAFRFRVPYADPTDGLRGNL